MKLFAVLALVALVGCAVEARSLHARDLKTTLITRGNDLVKKAEEAITKLETAHKTHEVTVVKSEEAKIKKLIADLEAATDDAKVSSIEHELTRAEQQLQFELAKINHTPVIVPHLPHLPVEPKTPVTRDLKETLTTRGNDLIKKADEAITKLTTEHKTHEVTVVKTEEAKIKKLLADLEAATDDAKIKTIEHDLTRAEHQLAFELQKIEHAKTNPHVPHVPTVPKTPVVHTPVARDAKSDLLAKGTALLKKADAEIKKLEAAHNTHEATIVKTEEAKIKKLVADLEAATDDAKIKTIEHNLSTAEHKLETELAKIAHNAHPATKAPHTQTTAAL